jgi:hypothetical protein
MRSRLQAGRMVWRPDARTRMSLTRSSSAANSVSIVPQRCNERPGVVNQQPSGPRRRSRARSTFGRRLASRTINGRRPTVGELGVDIG